MPLIRLLSLVCLSYVLIGSSALAQEDQLFAKDGRSWKGKLVEEVPGSHALIQLDNYDLIRLPESDIDYITRPKAILGHWEVIQLVNGGDIQGFLLEYEFQRQVKIEDQRENVFQLEWFKIAKISKEPVPTKLLHEKSRLLAQKEKRKAWRSDRSSKPGDGLFFLEGGFMAVTGQGAEIFPAWFGQAILSTNLGPNYHLGVGIGFDQIQVAQGFRSQGRYVFLDNRLYLPRPKLQPYVQLSGGYDWFRQGWFLAPGSGARFSVLDKFWFNAGIALKVQQVGEEPFSGYFPPGWLEMLQFRIVID
ncbi:MAG: hypothetical protein AAF399_05275 [Bacteroidota bacterium]